MEERCDRNVRKTSQPIMRSEDGHMLNDFWRSRKLWKANGMKWKEHFTYQHYIPLFRSCTCFIQLGRLCYCRSCEWRRKEQLKKLLVRRVYGQSKLGTKESPAYSSHSRWLQNQVLRILDTLSTFSNDSLVPAPKLAPHGRIHQ